MHRKMRKKAAVAILLPAFLLASCGKTGGQGTGGRTVSSASPAEGNQRTLTIGFAQVGEESDWRMANSRSIEETFTSAHGYHLLFEDAQGSAENQITSIRDFIQQGVDYIVLEPVVETGWDTVLEEAKEANIPVIVADRKIEVKDDSLYTAWVGSDCLLEGQKICQWLKLFADARGIPQTDLRIVNLQGTIGSTPQIEREKGLKEACEIYHWNLLAQERGEFTQAKGREAMAELLASHPDLNVVYCDNDNSAFGALETLQKEGRKIGTDLANGEVLVLSFDGTNKGLRCILNGTIGCIAECNPLHGPRIESIIRGLEEGKQPEKIQYVDEELFAADNTVPEVSVNGTSYPVKAVTGQLISDRGF